MAYFILFLVLFSPIFLIFLIRNKNHYTSGETPENLFIELLELLAQGLGTIGVLFDKNKVMTHKHPKVRSYECTESTTDGTFPARRNMLLKEHGDGSLKSSPVPGKINNLNDILNWTYKSFGEDCKCIGWRDLIREIEEEKEVYDSTGGDRKKVMKKWTYYELTDYKWMTAKEFVTLVNNTSYGLASLGVKPGEKILIYARTSYKWLQFAHACWHRCVVVVTAYESLDQNGLLASVVETEASYVFADSNTYSKLVKFCGSGLNIKGIILSSQEDKEKISLQDKKFMDSYKITTLDELVAIGEENPVPPASAGLDDTCCVMYTSGTGGGSKGVELTHGNLLSAISGVQAVVEGLESSNDSYLAYLPMSHVLECVIVNVCLFYGIKIGFGSIWTLNNDSVRNCKSDLQALCPSVIAGVPAVWESMKRNILTILSQQSLFKRVMFKFFFHLKWYLMHANLPTSFIDNVIFKRIKHQLGGRVRFVLNGGAPIHPSTKKFINVCAVSVINGYGLTETTGMGAVQYHEDSNDLAATGPPTASVEVKLAPIDDEDGATNSPSVEPTGEVWIRGPAVMKGYYKNPELTKKAFTEDGWFKTGDVGSWTKHGTLKIVGRIRNLVKLSNGEYVSLDKLDALYRSSPYVENVCVFYRDDCPRVVALISPVEKALFDLALSLDVATKEDMHDLAHICSNKKVTEFVYKNLVNLATTSNFNKVEIPAKIALSPLRWTPENKYLTAAFKVCRANILEFNNTLVNKMLDEVCSS